MRFLFVFGLGLVLAGCGKLQEKFGRLPEGQTNVQFALGGEPGAAQLNAIMVYTRRSDATASRASRFLPFEGARLDWSVPNGRWDFFAVGYPNGDMTGTMKCGMTPGISLQGGSVTIVLELNSSQCSQQPFSATGTALSNLGIATCHASNGDISLVTGGSPSCNGSGKPTAGTSVGSVRIALLEHFRFEIEDVGTFSSLGGDQMNSGCVTAGITGGAAGTTSRKIPTGFPFVTRIDLFSDAACGTRVAQYTFFQGVHLASNLNTIARNSSDSVVTFASSAFKIIPPGNLHLRTP